jgi:hypothetical protein
MLSLHPLQRENQCWHRSCARNTNRRLPPTHAMPPDEIGRVYLAAFRLRAFSRPITSSPGIVFTRPNRTSSTRRLISSAQASSTPSSAGPSSRLSTSRSISKPRSLTESASALSRTSKPCADICAINASIHLSSSDAMKSSGAGQGRKNRFPFDSVASLLRSGQALLPLPAVAGRNDKG